MNLVSFDQLYGHRNDVEGLRASAGRSGRMACVIEAA